MKNSVFFFPKYSKWVFIFLLTGLGYIYNYQETIILRPQSLHQWRQCDCLSFTMNYYMDNNKFMEPAVHNLGIDGTGKSMSEFPLMYFFVGKLWKVFGHYEFIFRLLVMLLAFTGLTFLFITIEKILKDSLISMMIVLLLFTSPMLVFYANNFLINTPAMALAMVGWFFFYKFYTLQKNRYLLLFCFFFLIAGLLKITATFTFVAVLLCFIAEYVELVKLKKDSKVFKNPLTQIIPFLFVFILLFLWFRYAHQYNSAHNKGYFLIGILPIWDVDKEIFLKIFDAIKFHYRTDYFNRWVQIILFALFILIVFNRKKVPGFLYFVTIISSIGFALYIVLFFQALESHDYYVTNFLILMPLISVTFFVSLKNNYPKIYSSIFLKIVIFAFLIRNIHFADKQVAARYSEDHWMNGNRTNYTYALEDITPYLRSLGIQRDDKVIVLGDGSINISLYLMDQKGWTSYIVGLDSNKINDKIRLGAKYIMVYNDEIKNNESLEPYFQNKIGQYKIVDIYRTEGILEEQTKIH